MPPVKPHELRCRSTSAVATAPTSGTDPVLARLNTGLDLTPRERELYLRYVRALALLCECAPYVDEPDYTDLIDAVLAEAAEHYPLAWRRNGRHCEIAPRVAGAD